MHRLYNIAVFLLLLMAHHGHAQTLLREITAPREIIRLHEGWHFVRTDSIAFAAPDYDHSSWPQVSVPHDWAITGPFSPTNDRQHIAITQDGQTDALEHAGRTGGLPFVGAGWYRYSFDLLQPHSVADMMLYIDGAMSQATVYVNGTEVSHRPYGYSSYYIDITSALRPDQRQQTIAVRLDNPSDFSRWYPGAGLYRNAYLVVSSSPMRIQDRGITITTPTITDEYAVVEVRTELRGLPAAHRERIEVVSTILDGTTPVATHTTPITDIADHTALQQIRLPHPQRWSVETPHLYRLRSEVRIEGQIVDAYTTRFGVRDIALIPDKGFFLNGERVDFKGVCLHHDLGPLGVAINEQALRRQVLQMKDMGANAIRTSHNMPAPELVEICDELGMMLMLESFDEWRIPKVKNGYHRHFDKWAEHDLVQLIRNYRNAPSVVMWCIGNEVYEQGSPGGNKVARYLQDICHREDPTRPVTQGMDNPTAVVAHNFASLMDVAGFNYRPWHYPEAYAKLPQSLILGTETGSTLSSRGVYKFPVERRSMATYPDHQASSYDVEHCGWSNLPEDDWIMHDDYRYTIGEFIWTGIDYLGEPTPYYTHWPSHSSLFGAVDLAGIPKDRYYLYRSHWNHSDHTLHILPHWNWRGREGEVTPIFVYTDFPSAELFINGKSQGRRTKDSSITFETSDDKGLQRQTRYRLMWMDTRYEPGTVEVIAYDHTGQPADTARIATTGAPYAIRLTTEEHPHQLAQIDPTDTERLIYVRVSIVDQQGHSVPDADHEITLQVEGAARYVASANGDPTCVVPFQSTTMPTFSGAMTTIIAPNGQAGLPLVLRATAPGLRGAELSIDLHSSVQ